MRNVELVSKVSRIISATRRVCFCLQIPLEFHHSDRKKTFFTTTAYHLVLRRHFTYIMSNKLYKYFSDSFCIVAFALKMSLPTLEGKINWAAISAEEEDSFVPDVCEVTYAEAAEGVSKLTAKIGKIMESESSRPPGFGFLMDGQGLILPEDSKTIQSVMASDEFSKKRSMEGSENKVKKVRKIVNGPTLFPDPIFNENDNIPSPSPAEKVTKKGISGILMERKSSSCGIGENSEKCWEKRERIRRKQIEIGKSTEGYKKYISSIAPSERRTGIDPITPDASRRISKRTFDAEMRVWRKALHDFEAD